MDFSKVRLRPVADKPKYLIEEPTTTSQAAKDRGIIADDRKEYFDTEEEVEKKVLQLADLIKASKHMIIYTGAGISTSANLPDFRSPNGIWTKLADGENAPKSPQLTDVSPTLAHLAIAQLVSQGYCKFVVTTNLDGLHLRSGVPIDKLAELHGNAFKKACFVCHKYWYSVPGMTQDEVFQKIAKGECPECGNDELEWTNVDFSQALPDSEINKADKESTKSDLALVLGSSMRVYPACQLPVYSYKYNRGHMVICNLQKTPKDDQAAILLHAKTDQVMLLLMKALNLSIPECPSHVELKNGVIASELYIQL